MADTTQRKCGRCGMPLPKGGKCPACEIKKNTGSDGTYSPKPRH